MQVLLVDDDVNFVRSLELSFSDISIETVKAYQASDLTDVDFNKITHAIVDLRIQSENGLNLIEKIYSKNPTIKILMLTGFGSIATAVEAIKLGAFQYLTKPVSFDVIVEELFKENEVLEACEKDYLNGKVQTLAEKEREYIEYILQKSNGNITQAAKALGLHRQSLQRMLKKYSPQRVE